MEKRHEIIIRAVVEPVQAGEDPATASLEMRCSCGTFLLDKQGAPAEVSLAEITMMVTTHYMQSRHPEKGNGNTKLIPGKKK